MKKFLVFLLLGSLIACAYTVKSENPVTVSKGVYLEALHQFNDLIVTVNMSLKNTPEAQRAALKKEYDKYILPAKRGLDSWKLALNIADINKVAESQQAFMEAKQELITFLYMQFTK